MASKRRTTPKSVRRVGGRIEIAAEEVQKFMASDSGRTFRRMLAGGLVLAAPLLFRTPVVRRFPWIRYLEVVGGAAIIVKLAEKLRDWEPGNPQPIVLDVPGEPRP